jgi:hypothetical protein
MWEVLDVGSGTPSPSRIVLSGENIVHVDRDRRAYHLEVVCDIHHLPFKPDTFPIVHASHIFEHVESPWQAVKELSRVSSHTAIIKVPNGLHYRVSDDPHHIYSWNSVTLENLAAKFFSHVTVQTTLRLACEQKGLRRKLKTLKTLLLSAMFQPNELTAICKK